MGLTPNHEHGYFLLSRSVFESDIWCLKPPEYAKLWVYLIGEAAHRDRTYRGYTLKRGQLFCSAKTLVEQMEYRVGYRTEGKSVSTVKRALKFLRDTGRITYVSAPRGYVITVLRYDEYQTSTNYERTSERTKHELSPSQKRLPINNKENTGKHLTDVSLRERLVMKLMKCGEIGDADAYLRKIEQQAPLRAIEKAMRDWERGLGVTTAGTFFARSLEYAEVEKKKQAKAARVALLSSNEHAES